MIIEKTENYTNWFDKQKDVRLIARIQKRELNGKRKNNKMEYFRWS